VKQRLVSSRGNAMLVASSIYEACRYFELFQKTPLRGRCPRAAPAKRCRREPRHDARFVALMDSLLPSWRSVRQALNRLPVRHEAWGY
jgi:hypothetical protein